MRKCKIKKRFLLVANISKLVLNKFSLFFRNVQKTEDLRRRTRTNIIHREFFLNIKVSYKKCDCFDF